jgi:hypothetical protein
MSRPCKNLSTPVVGLRLKTLLPGLAVALALHPGLLWACAACAGQSDSPMAKGMNWGIMSLLAVIGVVLGGVASFFVYLAKKSATVSATSAQPNPGRASVPTSPSSSGNLRQSGLTGALALPNSANRLLESTNTA